MRRITDHAKLVGVHAGALKKIAGGGEKGAWNPVGKAPGGVPCLGTTGPTGPPPMYVLSWKAGN